MRRLDLMKAALKFVEENSGTCGNSDVDQERTVTNLSKLLQKTYEAGLKEAAPKRSEGK